MTEIWMKTCQASTFNFYFPKPELSRNLLMTYIYKKARNLIITIHFNILQVHYCDFLIPWSRLLWHANSIKGFCWEGEPVMALKFLWAQIPQTSSLFKLKLLCNFSTVFNSVKNFILGRDSSKGLQISLKNQKPPKKNPLDGVWGKKLLNCLLLLLPLLQRENSQNRFWKIKFFHSQKWRLSKQLT